MSEKIVQQGGCGEAGRADEREGLQNSHVIRLGYLTLRRMANEADSSKDAAYFHFNSTRTRASLSAWADV